MMILSRLPNSRRTGAFAAFAVGLSAFILASAFFLYGGPVLRGIIASVSAATPDAEYAALSKAALASRLKYAERELSRIRYQATLYALLAEENKNLRTTLRAPQAPEGVLGRILARPPYTPYDTLLIGAGSENGVSIHDLVIFEGIALGTISRVDAKSAVVTLFSTSGITTDVILGEPRAVAIAEGRGGGAFELSVPQGVVVTRGDVVRLPAQESLAFGIVSEVSFTPVDVSQTVFIRTPVSLPELDFVRIVPKEPLPEKTQ